MKKELELQLVKKFPVIFKDYGGDMRDTCMHWGFECGDGWYDLIHNLCEKITLIIGNKNIKVTAHQVKEKFGGLRFYYGTESPETFMSKVNYIISHFMFGRKWGRLYWKIIKFKRKLYMTTEEKISDAISDAEYNSYETCERCGKPGKVNVEGYWKATLCDKCRDDTK